MDDMRRHIETLHLLRRDELAEQVLFARLIIEPLEIGRTDEAIAALQHWIAHMEEHDRND